jgi:hypothetical protein
MSIPEPSAPVQSVFAVPAHLSAITLAGGCGESHHPQNGAVDCARCAAVVKEYTFPAAPEQPVSAEPALAQSAEAAAPVLDASASKPKRNAPADDAAPSA